MSEKINPSTLADEVADRMRALLVSGEFAAGERLTMRALKTRFGISHIPIREAVRMLEVEGLIETTPQRGAVAATVSPDVVAEIYDARRLLEPTLAGRAADLATEEQLADLRDAFEAMVESESPGHDFHGAHARFHRMVLAPALTATLERLLNQLWGISERFIRLSTYPAGPIPAAREQHREIYRLMRDRSPEVARVLDRHLRLVEGELGDARLDDRD